MSPGPWVWAGGASRDIVLRAMKESNPRALSRRKLSSLALVLLALPIMGQECAPLVSPSSHFVIVEDLSDPVAISAVNLEGAGLLEMYSVRGEWEAIFREPTGDFWFEAALPLDAWHCELEGEQSLGCVAKLRVSHDEGPAGHNAVFGTGIIHVCSEDYVQTKGRKHCGHRELERLIGNGTSIALPASRSAAAEASTEAVGTGVFRWDADPWSRLIWGIHTFLHEGADHPVNEPLASENAGIYYEYAWSPHDDTVVPFGEPAFAPLHAYHLDTGACSIFIPWEWKDRLRGALYTAALGAALENRGLAERFIDEMMETTQPRHQTEVNALLWIDATIGIDPLEGASPEFHFRLDDDGVPQMCFKQYFTASSGISAAPDSWYRFDQAIGAFFTEILPFVGQCGFKRVSFRYCGTPKVLGGAGSFEIDPSSVRIAHEGYPRAKVLCNKQFVPKFIEGSKPSFAPGGDGAAAINAGIATLVERLGQTLGVEVRRIEMTPRGLYLITATTTFDPQYGIGDCGADIGYEPIGESRPSVATEIKARGVHRSDDFSDYP